MNILKYFYGKGSLKRKILDIEDEIKSVVIEDCSEKIFTMWYGAYDIDPKHLVYWVCVETDNMRDKLSNNKELNTKLHSLLFKHEYPAAESIFIGFESKETVDRESSGVWWNHFR